MASVAAAKKIVMKLILLAKETTYHLTFSLI